MRFWLIHPWRDKDAHIDPDLFDIFVSSKVYLEYGRKYLPDNLLDEVNEDDLLTIQPKPFEMPNKDERDKRWDGFLLQYQKPLQPTQSSAKTG